MTLYQQLIDAGCLTDHHESDLLVLVTDDSMPILHRYHRQQLERHHLPTNGRLAHVSRFWGDDGRVWWEVFGAYDPFWEETS